MAALAFFVREMYASIHITNIDGRFLQIISLPDDVQYPRLGLLHLRLVLQPHRTPAALLKMPVEWMKPVVTIAATPSTSVRFSTIVSTSLIIPPSRRGIAQCFECMHHPSKRLIGLHLVNIYIFIGMRIPCLLSVRAFYILGGGCEGYA